MIDSGSDLITDDTTLDGQLLVDASRWTILGSMTFNEKPLSGRLTDDVVVMAAMVAMAMLTVFLAIIQS